MIKLVTLKKIKNNDVYYFRKYKNIFIINDNYKGLIFLNNKLEVLKKLFIMNDLIIYDDYRIDNKIILDCPDSNCFICINMDNFEVNIIDWNKEYYYTISMEKYYKENTIIFLTKSNEKFLIDIQNHKIRPYKNNEYKIEPYKNINHCICKTNDYEKLKLKFSIKNPEFIVVDNNIEIAYNENVLEIIDKNTNKVQEIKPKSKNFIFRSVEIYVLLKHKYLFILENNNCDSTISNLLCYEI